MNITRITCDVRIDGEHWKTRGLLLESDVMFLYHQNSSKIKKEIQLSQRIFLKVINETIVEDKKVEKGLMLIDKTNHTYTQFSLEKLKDYYIFLKELCKYCDAYGCFG